VSSVDRSGACGVAPRRLNRHDRAPSGTQRPQHSTCAVDANANPAVRWMSYAPSRAWPQSHGRTSGAGHRLPPRDEAAMVNRLARPGCGSAIAPASLSSSLSMSCSARSRQPSSDAVRLTCCHTSGGCRPPGAWPVRRPTGSALRLPELTGASRRPAWQCSKRPESARSRARSARAKGRCWEGRSGEWTAGLTDSAAIAALGA